MKASIFSLALYEKNASYFPAIFHFSLIIKLIPDWWFLGLKDVFIFCAEFLQEKVGREGETDSYVAQAGKLLNSYLSLSTTGIRGMLLHTVQLWAGRRELCSLSFLQNWMLLFILSEGCKRNEHQEEKIPVRIFPSSCRSSPKSLFLHTHIHAHIHMWERPTQTLSPRSSPSVQISAFCKCYGTRVCTHAYLAKPSAAACTLLLYSQQSCFRYLFFRNPFTAHSTWVLS